MKISLSYLFILLSMIFEIFEIIKGVSLYYILAIILLLLPTIFLIIKKRFFH